MGYTVGQVAELSRVSIRTLHHYDQIGLLRPSGRSGAGYRIYEARDLERLQAILFQRALGLSLEEIRKTLDDPAFDRLALLKHQRERLALELGRIANTLALLDRTITNLETGADTMTAKAMFDGFDPAAYEEEAETRWGDTEAYQESKRRTRGYSADDWAAARAEGQAVTDQLRHLMLSGVLPGDPATRPAVEAHRAHIDRWFYPCSHEMQRALAEMYVADPRFARHYEEQAQGLAAYVRDAILTHSARQEG